jgi:hypothetical protein
MMRRMVDEKLRDRIVPPGASAARTHDAKGVRLPTFRLLNETLNGAVSFFAAPACATPPFRRRHLSCDAPARRTPPVRIDEEE